jgi:sugar lactone lactonase YvrE
LGSVYAASHANMVIYGDGLAAGWENWSWEATVDPNNAAIVHSGAHALAVTYNAAWAGLSLRSATAIETGAYRAIRFWAHGGDADHAVTLYTEDADGGGNASASKSLTLPANAWAEFTVALSELGNPQLIKRLNLQDASGAPQSVFFLDDVEMVATESGPTFPDATPDRTLNFPGALSGVAIAPNGRLYVAAWRENRVYSWPNAATAEDPAASADLVFGDVYDTRPLNPDDGCGVAETSASLLCGPESVAVDSQNNLYVADTYNHRVLIFFDPDNDADPTEADAVLGQCSSFASHAQHMDSPAGNGVMEGFSFARGLALEADGDLWVIDQFGHRAVRFNQPLTTDTIPDLVVGQADLTALGANNLQYPLGVAVDGEGNVYVADVQANQVVRFDAPAANQAAPDLAYTDYAGINPFEGPTDVTLDAHGNLYVAYNAMRKIGVFAAPLSDTTGDYVINDVNYPHGMAFDPADSLYVALCNGVYPCDNVGKLLVFQAPDGPPPTPDPTVDVTLTVDVAANRKPISDLIYGMNWGDETFAAGLDIPVRRWGGNRTTRYNWRNDMSNTAIDWYFENVRESNAANPPDDSAVNRFIAQDRRTGASTYLTVPLVGWVSNDDGAACSFDTAKYTYTPALHPDGAPAFSPDRPTCGSGVIQYRNGNSWEPIFYIGNDPLDTSIAVDASFAGDWATHLTGKFGGAANGGVRFYGMDNEPELWNTTHADVHPQGYSYDELAEKTIDYAAAIKAVDPAAQVLGPEFGGWWGYFTSALDTANGNSADRLAHGDVEVTAWYLQQLAAYEQANGVRLLDYLSLHFYPQADNVFLAPQLNDPATQQRRLRSVRALWDPTYVDESWIKDTADGPSVQLIPRMRQWIDANYPGTKLAISEYNWGGLDHINGALAQADILGVFGREGVDLAAMWDPPALSQPAAYAFRIYRNYDGLGARFGDVSVAATSSDQGKLSVYAAQRSSDGWLTLVIVNKSGGALTASVNVANFDGEASAQIYRYSVANLNAVVQEADQPLTNGAFTASFPADSITLAVIPGMNDPDPTGGSTTRSVYLPLVKR